MYDFSYSSAERAYLDEPYTPESEVFGSCCACLKPIYHGDDCCKDRAGDYYCENCMERVTAGEES